MWVLLDPNQCAIPDSVYSEMHAHSLFLHFKILYIHISICHICFRQLNFLAKVLEAFSVNIHAYVIVFLQYCCVLGFLCYILRNTGTSIRALILTQLTYNYYMFIDCSNYNIKLTNIKSNKCLHSTTAKADKSSL